MSLRHDSDKAQPRPTLDSKVCVFYESSPELVSSCPPVPAGPGVGGCDLLDTNSSFAAALAEVGFKLGC